MSDTPHHGLNSPVAAQLVLERFLDHPAGELLSATERDGLWCLVASELGFVPADGTTVTCWDDPVEYALFVRYVQAHPERVHATHEAALQFVRSRCGVAQ
jgi:hypothetical protein